MFVLLLPVLGLFIFFIIAMVTGGVAGFGVASAFRGLLYLATDQRKVDKIAKAEKRRDKRIAKDTSPEIRVDEDGYIIDERLVHRPKKDLVIHTTHFWVDDLPETI